MFNPSAARIDASVDCSEEVSNLGNKSADVPSNSPVTILYASSGFTLFDNNVKLKFLDHKLSSNKLNIFFEKNLLEAYGDLVYENSDFKLNADRLELDLISKNSKIYNLDDSNVVIETINK